MDEEANKNLGARVGYEHIPGSNTPLRNFEIASKFPQTGEIMEQTVWCIIETEDLGPPGASGDLRRQEGSSLSGPRHPTI